MAYYRFGPFELDAARGELRKNGTRIPIQNQPFQVLRTLVERPDDLVSREDLRQAIWASDTFVDFEHGLNAAMSKIRRALGDAAEGPRYIETVPGKGYRFIAPVRDHEPAPEGRPSQAEACATILPNPTRRSVETPDPALTGGASQAEAYATVLPNRTGRNVAAYRESRIQRALNLAFLSVLIPPCPKIPCRKIKNFHEPP